MLNKSDLNIGFECEMASTDEYIQDRNWPIPTYDVYSDGQDGDYFQYSAEVCTTPQKWDASLADLTKLLDFMEDAVDITTFPGSSCHINISHNMDVDELERRWRNTINNYYCEYSEDMGTTVGGVRLGMWNHNFWYEKLSMFGPFQNRIKTLQWALPISRHHKLLGRPNTAFPCPHPAAIYMHYAANGHNVSTSPSELINKFDDSGYPVVQHNENRLEFRVGGGALYHSANRENLLKVINSVADYYLEVVNKPEATLKKAQANMARTMTVIKTHGRDTKRKLAAVHTVEGYLPYKTVARKIAAAAPKVVTTVINEEAFRKLAEWGKLKKRA